MFSIINITGNSWKILYKKISTFLKAKTFVIFDVGQPSSQSRCFHGIPLDNNLSPFYNESFSRKELP